MVIGQSALHRRSGFSLIELLIVIAVIVILMALLVVIVPMVRHRAQRTQCASNLRGSGMTLLALAVDNHGLVYVPGEHIGGRWLWDLSSTWKAFEDCFSDTNAAAYKEFYCPTRKEDMGNCWQSYSSWGFHVTGYAWLSQRVDADYHQSGGWMTPLTGTTDYLGGWITSLNMGDAGRRVFAADCIISERADVFQLTPGLALGGIGDYPSHLEGGSRPAGANLLFLDGRVTWAGFEAVRVRTTSDRWPFMWW